MEESRKNIDELFKQGLGDYTEQPPAEVWAALDSRLTDTHTPKPSYKWLWYLIAAVVVGTLLFYIIKNAASEKATKHARVEDVVPPAAGNEPDNNANILNPGVSEVIANGGNKNALPEKEETKRNKINTGTIGAAEAGIEKAPDNKDRDQDKGAPHAGGNIGSTNGEHTNTGTVNSKKSANTSKATGTSSNSNATKSRNKDVNKKDRVDGGGTGNSDNAEGATSANTNRSGQAEKKKNVDSKRESGNSKTTDSRTANNTQSKTSQKTSKRQGGETRNTDNTPETSATKSKPGKSALNNQQRKQQSANDTNKGYGNNASNTASNNSGVNTPQAKTNNNKGTVQNKSATGGETKKANSRTSAGKGSNDTDKSSTAKNKNKKAGNDRTQPELRKEETSDNSTAKNENTTDSQTASADSSVPWNNTGRRAGSKVPKEIVTQENKDIKYESAFVADKNREGGIKVSDYMDTENDGEQGSDMAGDIVQKEEKPQAKGGGGGGSTSAEEEKKEKQNRKGKFDFGAKLGYEAGFGSYNANKIVVTPYVQYSIARNISILLQPTVKYATINKTDIGDAQAYYRKGATRLDSNHIYIPSTDTFVVDSVIRRYYHSGTYDSISVKSAIAQKKYWEIELPVLLQYKLSKQLSFFFGGSVNFSKVVQIKDELIETNGFAWRDSTIYPAAPDPSPRPVVPTGESKVQYNGKPFNEYTGNLYLNATTNPVRVNLMFGVDYHVTDRLFFDLLLQQNVSNLNNIPNKSVRDIYKQSYIRVGIGYRFSK
jgi:hypothetical protein